MVGTEYANVCRRSAARLVRLDLLNITVVATSACLYRVFSFACHLQTDQRVAAYFESRNKRLTLDKICGLGVRS